MSSLSGTLAKLGSHGHVRRKVIEEYCAEVWSKGEGLSKEDLLYLGFWASDARELIGRHRLKGVLDVTHEIDRAFGALEASRDGLGAAVGKLYGNEKIGKSIDLNEAGHLAVHAFFLFTVSAMALVQCYRSFRSEFLQSDASLDLLRKDCFNNEGLARFVQDARSCLSHGNFFAVGSHYHLDFTAERRFSAGFRISSDYLSGLYDWAAPARDFINSRDSVDILECAREYFKGAERFYSAYVHASGLSSDTGYNEIQRLKQAMEFSALQSAIRLALQQKIQDSWSFFNYFRNVFTAEEIQRAQCFPMGSKEQVDFLISLRDPIGLCDESIRQEIYSAFASIAKRASKV